jgi:hypothetical protein
MTVCSAAGFVVDASDNLDVALHRLADVRQHVENTRRATFAQLADGDVMEILG